MPTGPKSNSRTRVIVTLMVMNVLMDMIVHIAHGLRKDTSKMQRRRTQWEVVCYTNDYGKHTLLNAPEGVGQEKGVAKQVSLKKY